MWPISKITGDKKNILVPRLRQKELVENNCCYRTENRSSSRHTKMDVVRGLDLRKIEQADTNDFESSLLFVSIPGANSFMFRGWPALSN